MARAQQRVGSVTVWMIIFAALWLTSTVFLVVLYTGHEELKNQVERTRAANQRLISPAEQQSLKLIRTAQPSGPTVVGLLEQARRETALLASGNEDDDPEAIRAKRNQWVEAIQNDEDEVPDAGAFTGVSLYEALMLLHQAYKNEHELLGEAQDHVETLDAEVARLVQLNADQKNGFDELSRDLRDQLVQSEAGRKACRTERDAGIQKLAEEFDARRAQCDADLTAERQRSAALVESLSELRRRYAAREERFGELLIGPEELATARQADGTVLMAMPGDDVVYIDLGREAGITLGLQFSVYSQDSGIPADGRAKATIEVVSIEKSSAECKVVRTTRHQLVLQGDLIANPIYDPDRHLTFLAVGQFDLDRDGVFDPEGLATVQAMISEWGGIVTDELNALTDFVILGGPPHRPKPSSEVSPERQERSVAVQKAWDRYTELVAGAKSLSVPVMTQDVFLNFLGYSAYSP